MTIQEIINILQKIALTQPNVRSVGEGDIYDSLNAEGSTRYAYFFITQNRHQQIDDIDRYSLNIFYVDRLEEDKSNKLQIQSIGKEVLGNVFNVFCEEFDVEVPTIEYQVFTERFSDYCAGVYATVAFEVMRETDCADFYDGKYGQHIPVKIINQSKSVKFTENGIYDITFDAEYTGLENVEVDVDVDVTQYIEQGRQEGFDEGLGTGVQQGRQEVYDEAQDLYVEQNGVYQGENLYKRVEVNVDTDAAYNQGVEAGKELAAADAVVLDVSSNGTYYTKYADIPEWNEPETGDGEFYDYLSVTANALATGYVGDTNTVAEIWFRHNGGNTGNKVILQRYKVTGSYRLYSEGETGRLEINRNKYTFPLPANVFNKIRFSTTGVWVNDILVSEFAESYTETDNQWEIGGNGNCAVGDYGMIKIDDNVYTPVAEGYLSSAGNILASVSLGSPFTYTFVKVGQRPQVFDSLIKQVDVNIKIDPAGLKFQGSLFTEVPDWLGPVTSASYNLTNMFSNCNNLSDISALSEWDVSNVTDMKSMFYYCRNLSDISALENWDISNVTDMSDMFDYCNSITDISALENWDTSNVTNMAGLFADCSSLTDATPIANWDTSSVTNMNEMFGHNTNLTTIPYMNCINIPTSTGYSLYYPIGGYYEFSRLTNVGGFYMKNSWNGSSAGLQRCPNLTYESCINILNALYDFTGNGETPTSGQGTLKVHSNFLTTVGDEISIASSKGWNIVS